MRKKSRANFGRILNSAHHPSQAKCQLVQSSYKKRVKSCFCHVINILLTELSRSVRENPDLGRVYKPHCVRSVLTTSVMQDSLIQTDSARLTRAKCSAC